MKLLCNPLNIEYKYQFCQNADGHLSVNREAADPSLVLFHGTYFLYPSMTLGFWWSNDLADWHYHATPNLPTYDYAPDVRVVGDWLYFCASSHEHGVHYRTKDPFSDTYEKIEGTFPFWDPNLFEDEDGRVYFYWGSSPREPIYGIELDPETMQPLCERVPLFANNEDVMGFERRGEDHVPARSAAEKQAILANLETQEIDPLRKQMAIDYIMDHGYIEGAWMTKHDGIYYLQYGAAGAQFNIYGDGVYVSRSPLGPFAPAKNNPFSYKPGGFLPGAGHGSTLTDREGTGWHISTMRISINHVFERRLGLWPTTWDADGEMACNQRYGDWPYTLEQFRKDPWAEPQWMLLSYGKTVTASSETEDCPVKNAIDENVRSWWKAATNKPGEWLCLDLGNVFDVRAVQINLADDQPDVSLPDGTKLTGDIYDSRWIDPISQPVRWILEGSLDGETWSVIKDNSNSERDLSHDFVDLSEGRQLRYLKLTMLSVPYGQKPCISGLRVFGLGKCDLPEKAIPASHHWDGDLDAYLSWEGNALGYVVCFGYAPNKLYHSYMTFEKNVHLGGLIKGQELYIRIDSFNEAGITHGDVWKCD
ncbi:MAG: family 43 glycosylhydrolase [Lachnospiraceae bacterium]|nr:family 43 glycosylhydrolase [Lachnospiraceae bacterium]